MPWLNSAELQRDKMIGMDALQAYNGLDCCLTFEIWESEFSDMESVKHSEQAKLVYGFERAMQGPSFTMSRRGVLVDKTWRGIVRSGLERELGVCDSRFQRLAEGVWDKPYEDRNKVGKKSEGTLTTFSLNYNSPDQLKQFFYEALQIAPRYTLDKGDMKVTTNREALEWIDENSKYGGIFARYIMKMRDLGKKIGVLKKKLSPDGRMRCSWNVAGTETGRWSSSEDPFGDGDNLQNWTKKMRRCVVADPGYKMFSIDYSQAESFVTGGVAFRDGRDKSYLTACRSGDLHTAVTRQIWTDLPWTGDPLQDRQIAEQPYYFGLSYREVEKKLGHGTNYLGGAPHLAKITRTDKESILNFQTNYFAKFPGIKSYHMRQIARVQMERAVQTTFGRYRTFFGHPQDSGTHRKAVAFEPQSTVGDMLNLAMWLVWYELDEWGPSKGPLQLLLQVHDNIVFQVPDHPEDPDNEAKQRAIVDRVLELLRVELFFGSEVIVVPADVECGWNWSPVKIDKANVDGLASWSRDRGDTRTRQSQPSLSGLD